MWAKPLTSIHPRQGPCPHAVSHSALYSYSLTACVCHSLPHITDFKFLRWCYFIQYYYIYLYTPVVHLKKVWQPQTQINISCQIIACSVVMKVAVTCCSNLFCSLFLHLDSDLLHINQCLLADHCVLVGDRHSGISFPCKKHKKAYKESGRTRGTLWIQFKVCLFINNPQHYTACRIQLTLHPIAVSYRKNQQ